MPLLPEQQFKRKPSRKQTRKNERKLKKARKLAFSVHKPIEQVLQDRFGLKKKKKTKRKKKSSTQNEEGGASESPKKSSVAKRKAEKDELEELKKDEAERIRRRQIRDQIKEDELEIKKFAKKLGYNKRKSKNTPQVFAAEGLDYILDVCDAAKRKDMLAESDYEKSESSDQEEGSDNDNDSDDDSAPLEVGSKQRGKRALPAPSIDVLDSDDSEAEPNDNSKRQRIEKSSPKKKVRFEEETEENDEDDASVSDPGFEDEDEDEDDFDTSLQQDMADEDDSKSKEDIYGRMVDKKTGQLIDRDPSGARRKLAELEEKLATEGAPSAEDKERLTRTIRGLVNRLNEASMVSSIRTFRDVYFSNSRNDVKQLLADCLFKASAVLFRLPDRLAMEYSVFLALTHTAVSAEITAYFIEALVVRLRDAVKSQRMLDDKSIENLCIVLSHMCNFKVIKSALVLDFLRMLLENFNEFSIELILLILTYAGFSIRREDPIGLKNFISSVHAKIDTLDETVKQDSKVRFMLETLLAIKNNNVLKLSNNFDPSLLEHYLRVYRGILKSYTTKETPLPVGLDDLLKAEEKGRWWIVGSAWVGAGDEAGESGDALPDKSKKSSVDTHNFDKELLALAKKSKMNTELRRTIFCLMMSAEDEMDAFEKLLKLRLKDQQEREIIHIAIVCCMREKSYNSYYSALIDKFCVFHKRFQLTTQYAMWDRLRGLAECTQPQRSNLAQLLADLLRAQAIGLTVLKVIEFGTLTPVMSRFLKRTLTKLLTECPEKKLSDIFAHVVQSSKFKEFTDGLQIFLHMVMKKGAESESSDDVKQRTINERVNFLDAIWGSDRSL